MKNQGMTLLEVMMAVSIFTIIMGALFAMALSIGDTQQIQDAKVIANDEARRALQQIVPELRQASKTTIDLVALPAESITYQMAQDLDGNGTAVNVEGRLELTPPRTIQRDEEDLNGDGLTRSQLVLVSGETVRVLANNIAPENEAPDANGVFGPAQDTNGNGRLDRGFWIISRDGGLEVTVQAQVTSRRGHLISTTYTEFVVPRN